MFRSESVNKFYERLVLINFKQKRYEHIEIVYTKILYTHALFYYLLHDCIQYIFGIERAIKLIQTESKKLSAHTCAQAKYI